MKVTVKFQNPGAILEKLGIVANEIRAAYAKELYASAEDVMTAAKELTPVDTGNLRASGHVQLPTVVGGTISVELGFGGPAGSGNQGDSNTEDVGYAEVVHEDLDAHHTVGQAKFLEAPMLQKQAEIQDALNASVADALRNSGQ